MGGAPPVPGLRPPAPNRARSNSDQGQGSSPAGGSMESAAPQLGGLFAGGMPKLRKSGGIKTGAYDSDPEPTSRSVSTPPPKAAAAPVPGGAAPRPPGAPPLPPGAAPPLPGGVSALRSSLRPSPQPSHSTPEIAVHKPKPPPPIGKKPPMPPPASRKPTHSFIGAPPPPPTPASNFSTPSPTPAAPPPPPPPGLAPRPPAAPRSSAPSIPHAPPPPSPRANGASSPALPPPPPPQATPPASPAPPPPPPPPSAPPSRPTFTAPSPPPPPPPPAQRASHAPPPPPPAPPSASRSMTSIPTAGGQSIGANSGALQPMDASAYTLTNGGSPALSRGTSHIGGGSGGARFVVQDTRFKFQPDEALPMPRQFTGGPKRYRAGRGSSVPLDLSAFQ